MKSLAAWCLISALVCPPMPVELIPDWNFEDQLAWSASYGVTLPSDGVDIVGSQLVVTNYTNFFGGLIPTSWLIAPTVPPYPTFPFVVGTEYQYVLDIDPVAPFSLGPLDGAYITLAGTEIWVGADGAGIFTDTIVATNPFPIVNPYVAGLVISLSWQDTLSINSLSVVEVTEDMIKYSDIRKGIRAILLAVTNPNMPLPANIAWENRGYDPVVGTPWIRETLLPGEERQVASDTLRGVGIMQYDLFWPIGDGTETIEDLADDIKNAFKPVTVIGTHSLVFKAERLPGTVEDERWYKLPIRLTWRAHSIG